MSAPRPSARLVRAVEAERAELERHRERLAGEAQELRASLARIEHGLAEIDDRRALLDRLAPSPAEPARAPATAHRGLLRGPAIRETAVRLLVERGGEALHYREWFELLTRAGHGIAGKDPAAVFLTQLSRSPAVRRGARAGVYELDHQAAQRLRSQRDGLQHELRALSSRPPGDLPAARARRAQLTAELDRTERALEELARVLAPAALAPV